jgi:Tol biopolymer transport system component
LSENNVADLLRRGIEAARDGDKATARQLLEQVVDLDEKSEKGWFWLASVVDTDEERRVCLRNVLHVNPNNERAKAMLEKLEARINRNTELGSKEEVAPGISRSQMSLLIGGGVLAVLVIVVVILLVVITNNNRIAADAANTQQAIVAATSTEAQNTAIAMLATSTAEAATAEADALTATQHAIVSPTPSPTETRRAEALPPTWTPTPEATPTPTRVTLPPPPPGVSGRIVAWGGRDPRNLAYLPIGYYDLSAGGSYTRIGNEIGMDPVFFPDGQRIVYTRYASETFDTAMDSLNLAGSQFEPIQNRWTPFQTIVKLESPSMSADGRLLVFAGIPLGGVTPQVFVLDLSVAVPEIVDATTFPSPLRQLTNDTTVSFSQPAISRDGTRVVVVRTDRSTGEATNDLQVIDVATGAITPITSDQGATTEIQPFWLPDGSQIVYAAAPSSEPNNYDIVVKPISGGNPSILVRDPADDRSPVVSPDGQYMAYSSNRDGVWDIYILNLQTRETYQLTATDDPEYPTDWWMP